MNARTRSVLLASGSVELYTPPKVLDAIRAFSPIAFDPCANPRALVRAERSIVLPEDGLRVGWSRTGLTFHNPPYGDALLAWAEKACREAQLGSEIITLVPARTDTAWWRALAAPIFCAWNGRIAFYEPVEQWRARIQTARGLSDEEAQQLVPQPKRVLGDLVRSDGAPFPAVLCYHGPRPEAFAAHFAPFGTIYRAAVPSAPRRRGRPRAALPPLEEVRVLLKQGATVRGLAAALEVSRWRAEEARRVVLGRPARVCKFADSQTRPALAEGPRPARPAQPAQAAEGVV